MQGAMELTLPNAYLQVTTIAPMSVSPKNESVSFQKELPL